MFFRLFIVFCFSFQILQAQLSIFDASRHGDMKTLKMLYADTPSIINKKNSSGYSPLMLASYRGQFEVVQFLVDKVESVDDDSKYGTPLMAAAVKGHTKIAKFL